jgi:hypothetical protein
MTRSHRIMLDDRKTFRHPITFVTRSLRPTPKWLLEAIGGLMARAARPRGDGATVIR